MQGNIKVNAADLHFMDDTFINLKFDETNSAGYRMKAVANKDTTA